MVRQLNEMIHNVMQIQILTTSLIRFNYSARLDNDSIVTMTCLWKLSQTVAMIQKPNENASILNKTRFMKRKHTLGVSVIEKFIVLLLNN